MTVAESWGGTLGELGLVETEPWVVEDTFLNRQRLREAGLSWTALVRQDEADGSEEATGMLDVMTPERRRAWEAERWERRLELLSDQDDKWSDYLAPWELLADAPVSAWVRRQGEKWQQLAELGKRPEDSGVWLPRRCQAIKSDGSRCWGWAGSSRESAEAGRCRGHLSIAAQVRRESFVGQVRDRLARTSLVAVDRLEALLDAESEAVRLRAATEILDRVGVKGGVDVSGEVVVAHVDATALVRERLDKLRAAREVEGEIVVVRGEVESG